MIGTLITGVTALVVLFVGLLAGETVTKIVVYYAIEDGRRLLYLARIPTFGFVAAVVWCGSGWLLGYGFSVLLFVSSVVVVSLGFGVVDWFTYRHGVRAGYADLRAVRIEHGSFDWVDELEDGEWSS